MLQIKLNNDTFELIARPQEINFIGNIFFVHLKENVISQSKYIKKEKKKGEGEMNEWMERQFLLLLSFTWVYLFRNILGQKFTQFFRKKIRLSESGTYWTKHTVRINQKVQPAFIAN